MKVGIVGGGGIVGSSAGFALSLGGIVHEIVWQLRLFVWFGGALVLLVGLVRILRAIELNRPFTLLLWEMARRLRVASCFLRILTWFSRRKL